MSLMERKPIWIVWIIFYTILCVSCKKDKVPVTIPELEPTKWELIEGIYDVYDTTGVYLYGIPPTNYTSKVPGKRSCNLLHG
jgi:hypothetical protein